MGHRSTDEVKREIESERERLGNAVQLLRTKGGSVRKRLPLIAIAAAGAGFVLRTVARRVFRRTGKGKDSRGRVPFLDSR